MSAEQMGLPPTTESTTSSLWSSDEAPLVSLLTLQGLKPISQMSQEEKRTFIRRLREARTNVQNLRAEAQRDQPKKEKETKKEVLDLSEYQ